MSATTPHPSDCDCLACLTDMTPSREQPTPGPWRVDPTHSLCIESNHGNIALVNLARASEADARLIAAVHDMRDALRKFVTAAKSWHDFHHGSATVQCDWLCECIPAGEAALAKAVRS